MYINFVESTMKLLSISQMRVIIILAFILWLRFIFVIFNKHYGKLVEYGAIPFDRNDEYRQHREIAGNAAVVVVS